MLITSLKSQSAINFLSRGWLQGTNLRMRIFVRTPIRSSFPLVQSNKPIYWRDPTYTLGIRFPGCSYVNTSATADHC
ncbi:hypothetical protein CVT25_011558 [Psilocybe cyanescens]|uniref:Uncharacterized protein n=1 Tax=Psilocybe cyanescens TaxID=93625 RepID=A0A409X0L3_PSICY|nr:hypothetical protein CVT25_011558 [Psilocybe cyanescens]